MFLNRSSALCFTLFSAAHPSVPHPLPLLSLSLRLHITIPTNPDTEYTGTALHCIALPRFASPCLALYLISHIRKLYTTAAYIPLKTTRDIPAAIIPTVFQPQINSSLKPSQASGLTLIQTLPACTGSHSCLIVGVRLLAALALLQSLKNCNSKLRAWLRLTTTAIRTTTTSPYTKNTIRRVARLPPVPPATDALSAQVMGLSAQK